MTNLIGPGRRWPLDPTSWVDCGGSSLTILIQWPSQSQRPTPRLQPPHPTTSSTAVRRKSDQAVVGREEMMLTPARPTSPLIPCSPVCCAASGTPWWRAWMS